MSYKYGPSIVTDGLVFYVDAANDNSYPGSGTTWSDMVGGANATLYNTPTYSSENGGYISFDGVNEGAQTTSGTLLNPPITVDAWVKPQTSSSDGAVVSNFRQPTDESFLLWWDVGGTPNFVALAFTSVSTTVRTSESTTRGTVNAWNHVAATLDTTSLKIYLNSVLQETVATGSVYSPTGYRVGIGADYYGSPGTTSRNLNGDVAAVKIYNRVLTAAEILQNYNALKNRFL